MVRMPCKKLAPSSSSSVFFFIFYFLFFIVGAETFWKTSKHKKMQCIWLLMDMVR